MAGSVPGWSGAVAQTTEAGGGGERSGEHSSGWAALLLSRKEKKKKKDGCAPDLVLELTLWEMSTFAPYLVWREELRS